MINAEDLTVEDVTPAVLEEGVRFTSRRSWHGQFGYDETEVDGVFDVLAEAWALLTRERDQWRVEAMAARPSTSTRWTDVAASPPELVTIPDPDPDPADTDDIGMLTFTEHRAVETLAELWGLLNTIVGVGRNQRDDLSELVVPVHTLQNYVLAQAAARAYPRKYRLMGLSVAEAQG